MSSLRIKLIIVLLALCCGLPVVRAQQPPAADIEQGLSAEQRHATGLDTLSPEQLAALNALLRERMAATSAASRVDNVNASAEPQSAGDVPSANSRRDSGGNDARLLGFTDAPIKSRLKGTISAWDVGTVFELDNGQQWKVLKGKARLYRPLQSPEVIVVPGLTGRWFLQIDPDVAKPRVYLIN